MGEQEDRSQLAAQMAMGGMTVEPTLFLSKIVLDPVFATPDKIEPIFKKISPRIDKDYLSYDSDFIEWRREQPYLAATSNQEGTASRLDLKTSRVDPNNCLWDFCKLQRANVGQVISFARRYGVLGIWPSIQTQRGKGRSLVWSYREPIGIWQDVAKRADGILRLTNLLYNQPSGGREKERERLDQWHKVFKLRQLVHWFSEQDYQTMTVSGVSAIYEVGKIPEWVRNIEIQKALLEYAMSLWLGQLTVTPRLLCSGANSDSPHWMFDVNCSPRAWDVDRLIEFGDRGVVEEGAEYDAWDVVRLLELDDKRIPIDREDLEWSRFEGFDLRSPTFYGTVRFRPSRLFNVITLQLAALLASRNSRRPCKRPGCRAFVPERSGKAGRPSEYCSQECGEAVSNNKTRLRMQKKRIEEKSLAQA